MGGGKKYGMEGEWEKVGPQVRGGTAGEGWDGWVTGGGWEGCGSGVEDKPKGICNEPIGI